MASWSKFADMAMSEESIKKTEMPISMPEESRSRYPYGLRICLTNDEIEKLGLDADCEVGDVIDLRAMATVTSVSKEDSGDGEKWRVELQIEKLAIENEAGEDTDD